jgi:ribosome assembly protein 4
MIYSCSEDQTIKAWDQGGQFKIEFMKHAHWVNSMSLSTEYALKRGCYLNNEPSP